VKKEARCPGNEYHGTGFMRGLIAQWVVGAVNTKTNSYQLGQCSAWAFAEPPLRITGRRDPDNDHATATDLLILTPAGNSLSN